MIDEAISYCIEHDILRDILLKNRSEVRHMLLTEFDEKNEYSCAVTPQVRQAGNRLSGLTETAYASLLA